MRLASSAGNSSISRNVSTCRSGRTSKCTGALGLMSSTATKPSALFTWSPSTTSLQKTQSGRDAMDAFGGHGVGASRDEDAYGSVDEPRRIVVAVSAPRAVDEYDEIGRASCRERV